MTKFTRIAALAAAAAFLATPGVAVAAEAAPKAKATAKIVKPLTLEAKRPLDFGTIIVGTLAAAQTVAITQTGGRTGCTGGLTCAGTPTSAEYKVTGTNNIPVTITADASDLTNTTSGLSEKLAFTPDAPTTLNLGSSGSSGTPFNVGGSIQIDSNTVGGLYEGDIEVTVDY